jgi:hypothetical protein
MTLTRSAPVCLEMSTADEGLLHAALQIYLMPLACRYPYVSGLDEQCGLLGRRRDASELMDAGDGDGSYRRAWGYGPSFVAFV